MAEYGGALVGKIEQLINSGVGACLNLEGPGEEMIQVVDEGDPSSLTVQIGYYPQSLPPGEALPAVGVDIPSNWELTEWEEDCFVNYSSPRDAIEVAAFVEQVCSKFYGLSTADINVSLEKY